MFISYLNNIVSDLLHKFYPSFYLYRIFQNLRVKFCLYILWTLLNKKCYVICLPVKTFVKNCNKNSIHFFGLLYVDNFEEKNEIKMRKKEINEEKYTKQALFLIQGIDWYTETISKCAS